SARQAPPRNRTVAEACSRRRLRRGPHFVLALLLGKDSFFSRVIEGFFPSNYLGAPCAFHPWRCVMAAIRFSIAVLLVIAAHFLPREMSGAQEEVPSRKDAKAAAKETPANVSFETIVYGKAGDIPLMLDLALPKGGKGPYPAILIFHGTGPGTGGRAAM